MGLRLDENAPKRVPDEMMRMIGPSAAVRRLEQELEALEAALRQTYGRPSWAPDDKKEQYESIKAQLRTARQKQRRKVFRMTYKDYFTESDDKELQNQLQGIQESVVEREITHSLPERRVLADIMGDMDEDLPEEDIVRLVVRVTDVPGTRTCLHLTVGFEMPKPPKAKADNEGSEGDEPEPADAGLPLQPPCSQDRIDFRRDVGGQCNTNLEADHRPTCPPVPDDRGEQNGMCRAVQPQVVESRARTPTLPDDESTGELEPADAKPRLQPQSPCGAASGRGVDPQQGSGSCRLSQHRDRLDDSDQTSDLEQCHPLVPDDRGEQDEDVSVVPPQAQEGRASIPRLSDDESNNDREVANTEPSMQPSASQERVNLQHNIGRRRRRRRCDTDEEEDCSPIVGSDAKQGKDKDVVRPPRRKRRMVNTSAPTTRRTSPKRQTRLRCTDSPSLQAQRPPPTQGPKRRQSQRSISKLQSSGGSALEEETLEAAFASYGEWPLEAVLKRVWVDGAATFQVEFAWNPLNALDALALDGEPKGPRDGRGQKYYPSLSMLSTS
ncbi:hypothetical protein B0T22DRAFT_507617 [Podospora appendiculata]|uniref:Uncharacterized protein n=1 Tax=Podospora appendiculata TaxID=314037 RepID=A0AAE0XKJ0_9PEZI|nr:hypothetical protein B0T22DRAFT_507617 [Podospora appendiculata]